MEFGLTPSAIFELNCYRDSLAQTYARSAC